MATAIQIDALWNGLRDSSGEPLAGGKIYTYEAGTTEPVSLYADLNKTSIATNPIILDSVGKAQVYGDGVYKFVVKDSEDVTIDTLDGLFYSVPVSDQIYGGVCTGAANTYAVNPSPAISEYTNGLFVKIIINVANTGASTININSLGAKAIKKESGATAMASGDLTAGALVDLLYDSSLGVFIYSGVSDITTLPNIEQLGDGTRDVHLDSTILYLDSDTIADGDLRLTNNHSLYGTNTSSSAVAILKLNASDLLELNSSVWNTAAVRTACGSAAKGANSDITELSACTKIYNGSTSDWVEVQGGIGILFNVWNGASFDTKWLLAQDGTLRPYASGAQLGADGYTVEVFAGQVKLYNSTGLIGYANNAVALGSNSVRFTKCYLTDDYNSGFAYTTSSNAYKSANPDYNGGVNYTSLSDLQTNVIRPMLGCLNNLLRTLINMGELRT